MYLAKNEFLFSSASAPKGYFSSRALIRCTPHSIWLLHLSRLLTAEGQLAQRHAATTPQPPKKLTKRQAAPRIPAYLPAQADESFPGLRKATPAAAALGLQLPWDRIYLALPSNRLNQPLTTVTPLRGN